MYVGEKDEKIILNDVKYSLDIFKGEYACKWLEKLHNSHNDKGFARKIINKSFLICSSHPDGYKSMKCMVDLGADINYDNSKALCNSVKLWDKEPYFHDRALYLIEKGIKITRENLFTASMNNSFLLEHIIKISCINVNVKDNNGWNAAHYALFTHRNASGFDLCKIFRIINVLKKRGIDFYCKNNDGDRPIDYASDSLRIFIEKD